VRERRVKNEKTKKTKFGAKIMLRGLIL